MSILAPPKLHQNQLSPSDYEECCIKRGLNREWINAGCKTLTITQATDYLGYPAKSGGILIEGANGQYQLRPHKPWSNKQGQKAPKYRTALGDEYDALLPAHPEDKYHWTRLSSLKQKCYKINDIPLLIITEGGFKAIALCSHDLPAIALLGVEMGLTPSKDDPQGKRYLVPEIERFAKKGFGFIFAFDADTYTKKPVKQALIKLARQIQKYNVPVYSLPEWDERDGKGVDDYINQQGIEEFRKQLLSQAVSFDDWNSEHGSDAFDKKPPKPDIIGAEIAERYRNRWVYCDELKTWLTYSLETEGIWTIVSKDYLAAEIHAILKARNIKGYGTNAYIENIIGTLKRELFIRKWDEKSSTDWLPFRNGVLELATNKLHEHSPEFRFTWQLPRDYTIIETGWQGRHGDEETPRRGELNYQQSPNHPVTQSPFHPVPQSSGWDAIASWMDEATKGNDEYKELLLCFAAAVLRGRNDLQKFLHLIGGGSSGKSTFTTLLTALVGESNTATMNLSELEDKHEIARIFGKRLVVLPDQDKAPKKMSNFKRLTGQDRLSGRRLFENGFEYVFGGLTVVTSNFPIFHTNLGSWLTRRVSMIPFDYQCPKHKKRDLMKEFEGELGAFTSYLLSIPETKIEAVLKGLGDRSLSTTVWESQTRNDGLAAWVNDWVIQDSNGRVRIGSNSKEWTNEDYVANNSTLYGSYAVYCRQSERSVKSLQNFSADLLELTNRTLGWGVAKAKVKINGKSTWVIKGLKLRSPHDNEPTVEERLEGDNQGDNPGDNPGLVLEWGDNLKPLSDMDSDSRGDQKELNKEETKINIISLCDSCKIVTPKEESNKNLQVNSGVEDAAAEASEEKAKNNSEEVVTKLTSHSQQEIEAGWGDSETRGQGDKRMQNSSPSHQIPPSPSQIEVVTEPVTEVVTDPPATPVTPKKEDINRKIDWQSYPYNSRDEYTLKNRALKVKERILDCSIHNDLIKLMANHKVSEPEIEWLVQNYLTSSERKQLENVYKSTQGNLFNQTEQEVEIIEYTLSEIIEAIDLEMKRLGWSKEQGRQYLMEKYGKRSRLHLADEEILEFWNDLKSLQ